MITTREVAAGDEPFLLRLYASTRARELARVPWPDEQKDAFVLMQFRAQAQFYAECFPDATFALVECDGEPAGRLYVHRREDEIRIVDITIDPARRNRGIGSALMAGLLAEGDRTGRRVTVHVERENDALRWYRRLGFTHVRERGFYDFLERCPAARPSCSIASR